MIRLGILMLALIVGLVLSLSFFGAGDERAERQAENARNAPRPTAEDPEAGSILDAIAPRIPEPAQPQVTEAPVEIVEVEAQTAPRVERFPGPALRPSPEYAGRTPEAAAPDAAAGSIMYVSGSRVNFRSGPSTGNPVIGALDQGSPVEALGPAEGDWIHIRDTGGREGYIAARFLSAQP